MLGGPIQDCEGKTGVGSLRVFRLALTRGLETRKEVLKLLLNPVSGEFRLGPFTRLSWERNRGGRWRWSSYVTLNPRPPPGSCKLTTGSVSSSLGAPAGIPVLYRRFTWDRSGWNFTKHLPFLTPGLQSLQIGSSYVFPSFLERVEESSRGKGSPAWGKVWTSANQKQDSGKVCALSHPGPSLALSVLFPGPPCCIWRWGPSSAKRYLNAGWTQGKKKEPLPSRSSQITA